MQEQRSGDGGTILLVEEDAGRRALLEQAFAAAGRPIELIAASSGSEALALLGLGPPDLIVAAIDLPDIPAGAFVPLVRSAHPDLPIFMMAGPRPDRTGGSGIEPSALTEAMRAGAADCLTCGPFDLAKLPWLALRSIAVARANRRPHGPAEPLDGEAIRNAAGRQAAEQRGRDLAAIAHDLRSPLSGLLAMIDIIEGGSGRDLPASLRDRLGRIKGAAQQIASLADEISDLALLETGRLKLSPRPIDTEEALQGACRLLEPRLRTRGTTLKASVPGGVPRLLGDPLRIRQILISLVGGLLKLAEGTALELVAAHRGGAVELTLREDPLRGIPVEALPHRFMTEARPPSEPEQGLDHLNRLGLSVARALAMAHGGSLRLPGDVEEGTLAVLVLPAEPAESTHLAEKPAEHARPQP